MASTPKISIGIPVYNEGSHIGETLGAISAQTFGDFEAIISDNASTDATGEICRDHCTQDSRFRYMRNRDNLGIKVNFNQIFQFTQGEYFKWWAADDLGAPTLLESGVDVLERDPRAVLAFSEAHSFEDDPAIPVLEPSSGLIPTMDGERTSRFRQVMQLLAQRPELAPVLLAAVMRASAIAATPLMGRYPASDLPFIARMALAGRLLSTGRTELFLRHRQGSGGQIDTMGDYEAMIAANKSARRPLASWIWARWRFAEATGMVLSSGFPLTERLALAKIVGEVAALRVRGWVGRQVPALPGLLPAGTTRD